MSAKKWASAAADLAVTRIINITLPLPALVGLSDGYIFEEQLFGRACGPMPFVESGVLPLDDAALVISDLMDRSDFPAAALAAFWFCRNWIAIHVVSMYKANWFAAYPTLVFIVVWGDSCLLSTTALAITVWIFLRGLSCGMIVHADTFLSRFGHSAGLLTQSLRSFVCSHRCNYSILCDYNQGLF